MRNKHESRSPSGQPGMLEVMRDDFKQMLKRLPRRTGRRPAVNWHSYYGRARLRGWVIILALGLLWAVLAVSAQPLPAEASLSETLLYPFKALLAAEVLRHVILVAAAGWISLRLAASYLGEVFEIRDGSAATRFILRCAFGWGWERVEITEGQVVEMDGNTAILSIGGPGWVFIHPDSAAVIEAPGGSLRIAGPAQAPVALAPFERLRAAIDLRQQEATLNMSGRTLEGIPVSVQGAKVSYGIRDGYDPEAIRRLVRDLPVCKDAWPQPLSLYPIQEIKPIIEATLVGFIGGTSLSALLVCTPPASESPQPDEASAEHWQQKLMARFREYAQARLEVYGIEAHWVEFGDWKLPAQLEAEQYAHAEQMAAESLEAGSGEELDKVRADSREKELLTLYTHFPLEEFQALQAMGEEPGEIMRQLAIEVGEQLLQSWKAYQAEGEATPPELENVVKYLGRVTAHRFGERM